MAARVFAVLAAVFLVMAVGIAALTPAGLMLGQGLLMVDMLNRAVEWSRSHSPDWTWNWVVMPFMRRPLWLIPTSLGLICAGLATTFSFGKASPSRRRRS